jgi:Mitochondrial carrier protein
VNVNSRARQVVNRLPYPPAVPRRLSRTGCPTLPAHVRPESIFTPELLPNTCTRTQKSSPHSTLTLTHSTLLLTSQLTLPLAPCFASLRVSQDHAFAGIGAGTAAVLCMNPLDLLKVKFQVSTHEPEGGIGRGIWRALRDIHASEGWRGLYRGLGPNVAGNASSWGLYFLLCVFCFCFCFLFRSGWVFVGVFFLLRLQCYILNSLFFFSGLRCSLAYSVEVITSSSAVRPWMRQTNRSPPHNISSTPPKRVRILLPSLANLPLTDLLALFPPCSPFRCRHGHPDKSNMGGQSADVHRGAQLPRRAQRPLECVSVGD